MMGFLNGDSINTMSVYGVSLKLVMDSRFFHPGYQMDDILFPLSAMKSTGKRIKIRSLDVPTLNGPTSGVTLRKQMRESIIQATRWTIGAAKVFHYFVVKLICSNYCLLGFLQFFYILLSICAIHGWYNPNLRLNRGMYKSLPATVGKYQILNILKNINIIELTKLLRIISY